MRYFLKLSFILLLISITDQNSNYTSVHSNTLEKVETYVVTFECYSCQNRNKFFISGPEKHTFKEVEFPINLNLKAGAYKMTYWQNGVQQIHLPFAVRGDSENSVVVKH